MAESLLVSFSNLLQTITLGIFTNKGWIKIRNFGFIKSNREKSELLFSFFESNVMQLDILSV